jgi:hypothetical protein
MNLKLLTELSLSMAFIVAILFQVYFDYLHLPSCFMRISFNLSGFLSLLHYFVGHQRGNKILSKHFTASLLKMFGGTALIAFFLHLSVDLITAKKNGDIITHRYTKVECSASNKSCEKYFCYVKGKTADFRFK